MHNRSIRGPIPPNGVMALDVFGVAALVLGGPYRNLPN